jgi:hypothetical protein
MGQTDDNEAGGERSTTLLVGPRILQWLHGRILSKTGKIGILMGTQGEATGTSEWRATWPVGFLYWADHSW